MAATRTRPAPEQGDLLDLIRDAVHGEQLDLVAEFGVETVGPSTINVPAVLALFDLEV